MTCIYDRAAAREQEMRDDALAARARRARAELAAVSATHCVACKVAILEPRRLALPGVQTCIDCQADIERRNPNHGNR